MNSAFDQLNDSRATGLETAKNLLSIKHRNLQKEKERLTAKYGKEHAEVQKIEARLQYEEEMFNAMDVEIARTKSHPEPFVVTSWRVQGLVLNAQGEQQEGLTVYLTDEKQQVLPGTKHQCSDAQGFYSITLEKELVAQYQAAKVFLAVAGKEGKKLLTTAEPIAISAGTIDYRDIILSTESCEHPFTNERTTIE